MSTDAEIEAFVRSFEDGSLPRPRWTHAGHLVLALRYLRRHGRDGAKPEPVRGPGPRCSSFAPRHDRPEGFAEVANGLPGIKP